MKSALLLFPLLIGIAAAQDAKSWNPPLTRDGQPDLQGVWMNTWTTPFQRPKELAGREYLTDAEVVEFRKRAKRILHDPGSAFPVGDGLFEAALTNPEHWQNTAGTVENPDESLDRDFDNRTSLVIDPPDGRIPPFTAAGKQRAAEFNARRGGEHVPTGARDLLPEQRCITYGVPRVGTYGTVPEGFQQIFQSPGNVVILMAGIHDARIIPVAGRPHLPENMRTRNGDSRGRWEGRTLVVDTTNFAAESYYFGSAENLHLTERFTRIAPDEIEYIVRAEDPTTWTKPWTAKSA